MTRCRQRRRTCTATGDCGEETARWRLSPIGKRVGTELCDCPRPVAPETTGCARAIVMDPARSRVTRLCRSESRQWVGCRLPTPDDGWSAARRRSWPPCRAARSPSRKPANATSLPRRSFAPGSAPMRRMAFPACAPPAFSNTAARARRDPADRAAADRLPHRMLARFKVW